MSRRAIERFLVLLVLAASSCSRPSVADEHDAATRRSTDGAVPHLAGDRSAGADAAKPADAATMANSPDGGTEARLAALLRSLPRIGDRYLFQDDLLFSVAQLRSYVESASRAGSPADRRFASTQGRLRCVHCYNTKICEPELSSELAKNPSGGLAALCAKRLHSLIEADYHSFALPDAPGPYRKRSLLDRIKAVIKQREKEPKMRIDDGSHMPLFSGDSTNRRSSSKPLKPIELVPLPQVVGALVPGTCSLSTWLGRPDMGDVEQNVLPITFSVNSFSLGANYGLVLYYLSSAVSQWNELCANCLYRFEHRSQYDSDPTVAPAMNTVLFTVEAKDDQSAVATSFFPHQDWPEHRLYLYPQFFTSRRHDPIGVLRHELGHILGLRHEHVRRPCSVANIENGDWLSLSAYDENSVMHYDCSGYGFAQYTFSDIDKRVIPEVYQKKDLTLDKQQLATFLQTDQQYVAVTTSCNKLLTEPAIRKNIDRFVQMRSYLGRGGEER